ncbi:MAG: DUF4105 domain-containing protein [Gemmatimonadetes bacterium]|nr:DUF4105 domain-containing protein [Gemmatimonadota bacterium]
MAALTLSLLLMLAPVHAPAGQTDAAPTDARVFLVTFGAGEQVWERFGHNALWIHDPATRSDVAYHYGLFDMSEEGFLLNFLKGRMAYSMGAADATLLVEAYRRAGRSATIQELALTGEEIGEMRAFLEWNLRPENRVYRYDYFRDNCSTRIRDVLDATLDGTLAAALRARDTPITWRTEAVALTAEDELLAAGMDLGLGPLADRDISRWELAFIPMRLRDDVREITRVRDGRRVPLVVAERELPAVGAPDERLAVPRGIVDARVAWMLLLGVLAAGLLVVLGWLADQGGDAGPVRKVARWGLALAGSLWGLLAGTLGLILLGLWALTDHEFAHANENLLQTNPLAVLLVALVPLAVAGRLTDAAFRVGALLAGLSVLGLLLQPLPVTPQANLAVIAMALPVHLGLLYALSRQRPRRAT